MYILFVSNWKAYVTKLLIYSQEIGIINFDVLSERETLLLTLGSQIEEISNICYHHQLTSHQICNVAKKICRSIQPTNYVKVWLN